ncbi:MAG: hypothetical protein WC308_03890 [archaeon]|jgi:hypothetical protein
MVKLSHRAPPVRKRGTAGVPSILLIKNKKRRQMLMNKVKEKLEADSGHTAEDYRRSEKRWDDEAR